MTDFDDHDALLAGAFDALLPHLEQFADAPDDEMEQQLHQLLRHRVQRLLRSGSPRAIRKEAEGLSAFLASDEGVGLQRTRPNIYDAWRSLQAELARLRGGGLGASPTQREMRGQARALIDRAIELFALRGDRPERGDEIGLDAFDLRVRRGDDKPPLLVSCCDWRRPVNQREVDAFSRRVQEISDESGTIHAGLMISGDRGFTDNATVAAVEVEVRLITFHDLQRSLTDLKPCYDAAVQRYRNSALERIYVPPDIVLQSDLIPGETVEARPLIDTMLDWIEHGEASSMTLLGDFGSGKTSFCQYFAHRLALRAELDDTTRVPLVIDLRQRGADGVTLDQLLGEYFRRLTPTPPDLQTIFYLNREGHLLLIFDGFDEIISDAGAQRFEQSLFELLRAAEGMAKVLITCRTHYFRDQPEEVVRLGEVTTPTEGTGATRLYEALQRHTGAEIAYLRPFDDLQVRAYLDRALPAEVDREAFHRQIQDTYRAAALAERPFLLRMIVETLPQVAAEADAAAPPRTPGRSGVGNLADLYHAYCANWFETDDFRITLPRHTRRLVVMHLARLLWNTPGQRGPLDGIYQTLDPSDIPGLPGVDVGSLDFELRTAPFLHRNPKGEYAFIHRSFLELFIAQAISEGILAGDLSCLDLRPLTREVVFFLSFWHKAASAIPAVAAHILTAPYKPRMSENALRLLLRYAHGRVGPLLESDVLETPEGRQAFSQQVRSMRPKALRLTGAELAGEDLRAADLRDAELAGANLDRADLRYADLSGADLSGASLVDADLTGADLTGAVLRGATLYHVQARDAVLTDADLRNTDLRFARMARVDFVGARADDAHAFGVGLRGSQAVPEALHARANAANGLVLTPQFGHRGAVNSVAWHPAGQLVASGGTDGVVLIWDATSGAVLRRLTGHRGEISALAWDPRGRRLASGAYDRTINVWNVDTGARLHTLEGHINWVRALAWDPRGFRLASGSVDQTIKIWDVEEGSLQRSLMGHDNWVLSVAWNADGTRLASASYDHTVRVWDVEQGRAIHILGDHENLVLSVAWDVYHHRLASGSADNTVRVWDADAGACTAVLEGHRNAVLTVDWNHDGTRLASGSADNTVRVWDVDASTVRHTLEGHQNGVLTAAWDPRGTRIATGSYDNTARVWDAESGAVQTLTGHQNGIRDLAWDQAHGRLITGSADHTAKIWDVQRGVVQRALIGHQNWVRAVAWRPDGYRVATGSSDNTVKIWDAEGGQPLRTLNGHTGWLLALDWNAAVDRIVSGSADNTLKVWDPEHGDLLLTFEGHEDWVFTVAWDPEGRRVASGSDDTTVRVWDALSGRCLHTLMGHGDWVLSVAWDPEGRRIASGSDDTTVRIWDAENARSLLTLTAHDSGVHCLAWDAAGRRLASGSADHTVKIWDAERGEVLHSLTHDSLVQTLAWRGDEGLFAGTVDGWVDLWDLRGETPRRMARLFNLRGGAVATPGGEVDGDAEALAQLRFAEGWALYDLDDVPELRAPERIRDALRFV
ncbi:MAG: pentapeptide repeat-containing protein [Acidobacteriota bacterium]